MVDEAKARIDGEMPVVPPVANPVAQPVEGLADAPRAVATQPTTEPARDLLTEVSWVDTSTVLAAEPEQPAVVAHRPAAHAAPPIAPVVPAATPSPLPTAEAHLAARTAHSPQHDTPTTEVEGLRWRDLDQQSPSKSQELPQHTPRSGPSGTRGFLREWAPIMLGALIVAALLRTFVVQAFEIPSASMLPTLETDDRIVVNQLSYTFGDISRGEVVVFERPPSMPAGPQDADYLVKRVIGLPGDEIQLFEGNVWINGERLVEDAYLFEAESTRPTNVTIPGCEGGGAADSCTVPAGFVFVLGDNRANSTDSRVAGPIEAELVVGRAVVRAWPLNALSWL